MHIKLGTRTSLFGLCLLLPNIAFFCLFTIYPLFFSLNMSMTDFNLMTEESEANFIGLKNYLEAVKDPFILESLGRTLIFATSVTLVAFICALGMALAFNEDIIAKENVRALALIPYAIPSVVSSVSWLWMFDAEFGVINYILLKLNLISQYVNFLAEPTIAFAIVSITTISQVTPFMMIILLAGLQQIPEDLYDSAKVDGAGIWQRLRYITLPSIRSVMGVATVLGLIWAFQVFDVIYIQTMGGPYYATAVLSFLAYTYTFKYLKFGYGAALSYILVAVMAAITFAYVQHLLRREK